MIVNGKKVEKGELNTVYDLLKSLNVNSNRVVVELNKEIVNSCNYNKILLNHEDVIEIIAFVGGG
ncbi:sulfur carrier protein ThiS [Clostridium perfringens]|uniref:Thiamine biosynthesis protein ThiS n=1 Tax=Clostridium perfringens TaxID=1502 RepID=A0A127EJM4_CLOPF|nr:MULTISPECIES: sulfur carrier protein ThiS [Clostridium]AMN36120.1 thiamine biosynthesis protein ThiS [Clostridium perfringens]EJT6169844.1 sulfur carrier protein ThiS [Clostridium perfringens]EJT6540567.1 sulfur carrier protein ThiS [Clostridium perfringens]EJT6565574.1 sulfur carrier protein ThiS [Clostridium perfringens]MBS5993874.1 sulfur carrier protein ThiS [Clostridium perfringens]